MESEVKYNRIVIIGNGFDLALGLKTRYYDFILHLVKNSAIAIIKNEMNKNILFQPDFTPFSGVIIEPPELIMNIENAMQITSVLDFLNQFYRYNYQYHFYSLIISKAENLNWVDIEHLYYKLLLNAFRAGQKKAVRELNKAMDVLSEELNNYILSEYQKFKIHWSFETQLDYLSGFTSSLKRGFRSKEIGEKADNSPEKILFLNFNYTRTIDKLVWDSGLDRDKHMINAIHGTVTDSDNPIIFGYGDDTSENYKKLEDENDKEYLRMIKSFKYPLSNNYHKLLSFMESDIFEVFVVGHSCGLSDRTLLKTIFEHDKCLAIQLYHYQGKAEYFDKYIEASRHFNDKVLMRARILPFDPGAFIPQNNR